MPTLVKIWPTGSEEEDENVKSLRRQRRRTNFDQKSSLLAFGSGKLKYNNILNPHIDIQIIINLIAYISADVF